VRWKVTLLSISGIGLVVAVLVVLLSMLGGFQLALRSTGPPDQRDDRAERLHVRADLVGCRATTAIDHRRPASGGGIRRQASGLAEDGRRGEPQAQDRRPADECHPEGCLGQGLRRAGRHQIVAGDRSPLASTSCSSASGSRTRSEGLEVGRIVKLQRREWKVVGTFRSKAVPSRARCGLIWRLSMPMSDARTDPARSSCA